MLMNTSHPDQISYFSVIAGILRAGYQAFPISPRNSDVAIAHLLRSTHCTHVLVSADAAMQKLVQAAGSEILALGGEMKIIPMPTFDQLFGHFNVSESLLPMKKIGMDEPAVILHSSGNFHRSMRQVLTDVLQGPRRSLKPSRSRIAF